MKLSLLLLILCAFTTWADSKPLAKVARTEALFTETIPDLRLKNATFEQAINKVGKAWDRHHPGETFPVSMTIFGRDDGLRGDASASARITIHLRNVPFWIALQYIGAASGRRIIQGALFQLETVAWLDGDWSIRPHDVNAHALAALHLRPDSSPAAVRRAFERFGVKFEDWMQLTLNPPQAILIVRASNTQQEQIAGILFLLRQGFQIRK